MSTDSAATFQQILDLLKRYGLLLVSDPHLPSVVSLVAGEPVRRSWWGHPRGKEMYAVLNQLAAREEGLMSKLVSGKETYVHQRLWSALIGVGTARESWQLHDLSALACFLLETLPQEQTLRIDQGHPSTGFPSESPAGASRAVDRSLRDY